MCLMSRQLHFKNTFLKTKPALIAQSQSGSAIDQYLLAAVTAEINYTVLHIQSNVGGCQKRSRSFPLIDERGG